MRRLESSITSWLCSTCAPGQPGPCKKQQVPIVLQLLFELYAVAEMGDSREAVLASIGRKEGAVCTADGRLPPPRHCHCAWADERFMYVYGRVAVESISKVRLQGRACAEKYDYSYPPPLAVSACDMGGTFAEHPVTPYALHSRPSKPCERYADSEILFQW